MAKTPSHEKIDLETQQADDSATVTGLPHPETLSQGTVSEVLAGKYIVLERLGSGGISTVYKVKHIHLAKIYALKLLHEVKPESIMRFQQEAKAATLLQHPNIVGVVDFGVSDGTPYMVMDCVEGVTLGKFATNAAMEPAKFARLFGDICLALAHAHEKGVIHRDIKPSNIIVTKDEAGVEHAVVVDFGIAKIIDEQADSVNPQLTRTGDIFGTPLYMSPEQCQGSSSADARSDIYSLGCVMYEFLTGSPPFEGDSPYHIIHKHMSQAPEPFSGKLKRIPRMEELESIILKAMAKNPADRFQYMLEMSSALKAIELGTTHSQFDLFFQFRMGISRLRASDKQSFLLKSALQLCSVLAISISLVIWLFPPQLQKSQERISQANQILYTIKSLFSMRSDSNDSIFRIRKEEEAQRLKQLNQICKYDPEIAQSCEDVTRKTLFACSKLQELKRTRKAMFNDELGTINMLSNLDKMEQILSRTVNYWSEANLAGTELGNLAASKMQVDKQSLFTLELIFLISASMAIPVELFLCALLFTSFKRKKRDLQAQISPSDNNLGAPPSRRH